MSHRDVVNAARKQQITAHAVETSAERHGAKLQVGWYLQLNSARAYEKINYGRLYPIQFSVSGMRKARLIYARRRERTLCLAVRLNLLLC